MSNISLELLKLFCTVAETGKIYKAAEILYISQPAVTQGIKKLENQLDGSLFYRTPKGVVLTEQGKSLYSFVKPSLDTLDNVSDKFSQYIHLEKGKIKIRAATTMGQVVLFEPLKRFVNDFPKIEIEMSSGLSSEAVELVSNGKVDIAIITLPYENTKDNVEIIKYKPLEQVFFATKKYLKEKNIDINDFSSVINADLILPLPASNTGSAIYNFFSEQNIEINPKYVISSNFSRKKLVEENLGIGICLKSILKDSPDLVISNLKLPILNVGIAIQKKEIASYASLKLVEYIIDKNEVTNYE